MLGQPIVLAASGDASAPDREEYSDRVDYTDRVGYMQKINRISANLKNLPEARFLDIPKHKIENNSHLFTLAIYL